MPIWKDAITKKIGGILMSKKISCLMLTFIILLTSFSSIFAQNNEEITNPVREPYNEVLVDQNVIDLLERE